MPRVGLFSATASIDLQALDVTTKESVPGCLVGLTGEPRALPASRGKGPLGPSLARCFEAPIPTVERILLTLNRRRTESCVIGISC